MRRINGYLYFEMNKTPYLFGVRDFIYPRGLFFFFPAFVWKSKYRGVAFERVRYFPKDTPIEVIKVYVDKSVYCGLIKKFGICDIECLTIEKPREPKEVVISKGRTPITATIRMGQTFWVNGTNWKLVNKTKRGELTVSEAEKVYQYFHFEKGIWAGDSITVEKIVS